MAQKLITADILAKLTRNAKAAKAAIEKDGKTADCMPVLKLFAPWGAATWLFTEYDAESGLLFGLSDLGAGAPELGYVSLREIQAIRGPFGLKVERDMYFTPKRSLTAYADEARAAGRIAA